MDNLEKYFDELEKWIDLSYKSNDLHDFNRLMELGIESGNHIIKLLILSSGTLTEDEHTNNITDFDLNDSVIVGHFVRIFKLYDQIVYFISENKADMACIFSRLLFESYARMKYLILNDKNSIDSYLKTSFKTTLDQYKYLKNKAHDRELFPIEKRMINKIENRINFIEIPLDELLKNKTRNLDNKTFQGILNYLEQNDKGNFTWDHTYSFLFGSWSEFVHGSWYDLEINHLRKKGKRLEPKYEYCKSDPRYILPVNTLPIHACIDFLRWRKTDPGEKLINILEKLLKLQNFLDTMDEYRINSK